MMNNVQKMEQEKSVLRWGGLAGLLGGILHILTFVVVLAGPVGLEEPADLEEWVIRFPDIRAARIVENGLYLVALILGVILFLALYRALQRTNLAPALFGSVLGILGLVVLAAGALPHVATAPLSDLYHASGATPEEQATLALMWQAAWGIFDALLAVGFFVVTIGLIALGVAMLGAPAFGKGFGWVSVVLGVVGLAAAVFNIVDPASMIAAVTFFAIIIYQLVLGWKVYSLSRAS
jgi:magnesium-transporting ATPase (P-type)